MLHIDKFGIRVFVYQHEDEPTKKFGRDIEFGQGLSVVAGDNTTGKTTLAKCLYYALGFEQLIEGKSGAQALDKSVLSSFAILNAENNEREHFSVRKSSVYVQISNEAGDIKTLLRTIVTKGQANDSVISVYSKPIAELKKGDSRVEYYLHNEGDHTAKNGYYRFLAEFANLPIIPVPAKSASSTNPLYLQIIFAACFIEQKKGWSDYFATARGYNIYTHKKRIIEYLLGIVNDNRYDTIRSLKEKLNQLSENWYESVNRLRTILTFNNCYINNLESKLSDQKTEIDGLIAITNDNNCSVKDFIDLLTVQIEQVKGESVDLKTSSDNSFALKKSEYERMLSEYRNYQISMKENEDKIQSIENQLNILNDEIKRMANLLKTNNIVHGFALTHCPTCHQELITKTALDKSYEHAEIKQSLDLRKQQRAYLESVLNKLSETIKQKEVYALYYEGLIEDKKSELLLLNPLAFEPTTKIVENSYKLSILTNKLAKLKLLDRQVEDCLGSLKLIKESYDSVRGEMKKLKDKKEDATLPVLMTMQKEFRNLLHSFGYTSHGNINEVYIETDKESSQQYFPMVLDRGMEETIMSASSASDFIRSLWAFYLTLLNVSPHHPGFLLMDEPGQHAVKEESLRSMLKVASECGHQVILFCSTHTMTEEYIYAKSNDDKEQEDKIIIQKNLVKDIVDDLNINGRNVAYVEIEEKSIRQLQ